MAMQIAMIFTTQEQVVMYLKDHINMELAFG